MMQSTTVKDTALAAVSRRERLFSQDLQRNESDIQLILPSLKNTNEQTITAGKVKT
jgi:hypothetical protein